MKKKLNIANVTSELRGNSPFFPSRKEPENQDAPVVTDAFEAQPKQNKPSNLSSKHESMRASKLASTLALSHEIIEDIRKIVKTPAKEEVLYVRVTKDEKKQLGAIEYAYKGQDIETSAQELGRIAVNFLIADYKANGENSVLAKVLAALNA